MLSRTADQGIKIRIRKDITMSIDDDSNEGGDEDDGQTKQVKQSRLDDDIDTANGGAAPGVGPAP